MKWKSNKVTSLYNFSPSSCQFYLCEVSKFPSAYCPDLSLFVQNVKLCLYNFVHFNLSVLVEGSVLVGNAAFRAPRM